MKYVICNYTNYSIVEIIESDTFVKVEQRLNKLNKGYNDELIVLTVHNYNKLIKGLISKLNKIKNMLV